MSMNDKSRHVPVPQPLPANFGPPVPPVGPGPGQGPIVGQPPWNSVHPSPYHMPPTHSYPPNFKNNGQQYPPTMHPAGYMPRYQAYDAQCQSFPFPGKIHEGPVRPHAPNAYPIVRHYNAYNDKDAKAEMFPRSKSPGQKEKNNHEKNGRDETMSSPSDSKSDSETNHTTTESCPEDTRSPTSLDKHNFFGDKSESSLKSDSNSHLEAEPVKKSKSIDSNSNSFSSISNSNNHHAKKENSVHPQSYEMRVPNPSYPQGDNMYGMFPEGERRISMQHNPNPHHAMGESMHFGYRDKLPDLDFEKSSENVFQVPSISSTTPPKIFPPVPPSPMSAESWDDAKYYQQQDDMDSDKMPRKKRKRCGECPGCLQKQNCGRCGPCRSVRSHQICKMRKCESLKTKKEKAAEDAVKSGRKNKDLLREERNSSSDIGGKMNGNPQSYLSQGDSLSPTNSSTMHLGNQSMRSHVDQYQPQGGNNFQPPGMVNSYNSNSQYGSYSPQVPPNNSHLQPMFDSRGAMEGAVDVDDLNSTHRMTNSRLKTLIHNRQNQREHGQLIPISNSIHDSPYNSSMPLSPISRHPSYASYLPPTNHQDGHSMHGMGQDMMHNSLPYSGGPSDTSTSSLMHLQQLSPNSISPQKAPQRPPSWSETPPRKTPEILLQKSPAKPVQNGHAEITDSKPAEEVKMVNGHDKLENSHANNNGALDTSSDSVDVPQNGISKSHVESDTKPEPRKTPALEIKVPPPESRVLQPLHTPPAGSPRYTIPSSPGFMTPPYTYRHFPPHQALVPNPVPNQPGCMPPPTSVPVPHNSTNGGTHPGTSLNPEANCDEPTQSSPFLLNTTTSMNTYISITNTYSNSKLSFSNATCLPTFALTSVSNSSLAYASSSFYNSHQQENRHQVLPQGGGTCKSYIDSGRIHDSLENPPRQNYRCQDLPLPPPNCQLTYPSNNYYHQPPFPESNCSTPVGPVVDSQDLDPMDRLEKLRTNTKLDPPQCDCLKNKEVLPSEKLPYYTHLGSGSSVSAIRELMECRSGEKGKAIRIEKLLYSGKEGKTSQGCPLAKWIIRRSGPEEKLLTVIRHRPGHTCPNAYIIIAMVAWEGIQESVADVLYRTVTYKTVNFGIPTQRKCGTNEMRTCACQGLDPETCGASFSFGCSWSMYYNGCKFARSKNARKFKLTEKDEEKELEDRLQMLASDVSHLYKKMAPESFYNQTEFEQQASECRLGVRKGRPFSGVTACLDYCAHSHKDLQNMNNGCTVVVTLTKHKGWEKPEDEQLHVLPLYVMDNTDEFGSKEGQDKKINSGAVEVLTKFPIDYRIRTTPLKPCKTRGRKPKDGFSPRKQALQAAFKQLISSGKLRRIDPPELYRGNRMLSLPSNAQPDSSADSRNPQAVNYGSREETACKFYAGKQVLHSSYTAKPHYAQGWASQNFNSNPTSSDGNQTLNSFNSPFTSHAYDPVVGASNNANPDPNSKCSQSSNSQQTAPSLTNTCSKLTSGTNVTSSGNAPCYNDSNNNYMPCASYPPQVPNSQGYRPYNPGNTQSTYSHYSPSINTNPLPPTFGSQNNGSYHHYSHMTQNAPHFQNNTFHGQNAYGYPSPNVPLKIPGNYAAASYPSQHSGGGNCQNAPYTNSHGTLNSSFCNYSMQKPHTPSNFLRPDNLNNFNNFYPPEQQNAHFPSHNANISRVPTPPFQNSQCSGNQSIFVKSEIKVSCGNTFMEKTSNSPSENSDSVYTMRDLDSKSVNCFSTSKQPVPTLTNDGNSSSKTEHINVSQCKKEPPDSKYYHNQNTSPQYRFDNYQPHAKNYNYHLQQSNMILDLDNFNDIVCNNYNAEYGDNLYKEGYEKGVKGEDIYEARREPVPNNKDLASMTKMTESPYPSHANSYPNEPNHLRVLASKYSSVNMDDEENFIDSTTLEGDEVYEGHSDNESSFKDVEVGGVAIALTHGSVLFECAKHELHSTTAVKKPNRRSPTRISLVFYQHKHLNFESHGEAEWGQKMKEKRVGNSLKNADVCFDVSASKKQCFQSEEVEKVATGFPGTTPTTSWVTVFSIAPLTVGAPYRP